MKKHLSFLIILIFFYIVSLSQSISIGSGTFTSAESPWDPFYGYSYVQTIYKSSEIVASGNITSITFNYAGNSLSNSDSIAVYMGHTTKNEFASTTDWIPLSDLSVVFNGKIYASSLPGPITIALESTFAYNGINNLVIAVDENKDGFNGSNRFNATYDPGNNRVLYYRNDNINPSPSNPPVGDLGNTFGNIIINGLTLANCQVVSNVTVNNFTATTVSGSWQAPSTGSTPINYQWEVRTNGAAGSGSIGLATSGTSSLTYSTITGLPSSSQFTFYVRAECASGVFGPWSQGYDFYFCGATTPPYFLDFESGPGPLPLCTKTENIGSGNNWSIGSFNSQVLQLAWGNTASDAFFFTQGINLTTGVSYRLEFKYGTSPNNFYYNNLEVGLATEQSAPLSRNIVGYFNFSSSFPSNSSRDFIPSTTGVYYFGFNGFSQAYQNTLIVDDISISVSPPCDVPTAITKSNITTTSIDLSWNAPVNGSPISYDLYYSTSKDLLNFWSTPRRTGITGNSITLSPLTANTKYYFYLRTACGNTLRSNWTPLDSFTTAACNIVIAPTIAPETFASGVNLPLCWSRAKGILASSTTFTTNTSSNWVPGDYLNMTTPLNKCANIEIAGSKNNDWLISPTYNLGGNGNFQLEFDLGLTKYNQTTSTSLGVDDKFYVVVSTDNGVTWDSVNTIGRWNVNTNLSNTGEHIVISLAFYTGSVVFGFYLESPISIPRCELFIDNIEIKPLQTVPVMLMNFVGERRNKINHLFWTTASEINSKGFEIQRSSNGMSFNTIEFTSSKSVNGNSVSALNYEFLDENTPNVTAYYRLKQINLDGSFKLSNMIKIKGDGQSEITFSNSFPNPVKDKLNVVVSITQSENLTILVCDLAGKVVIMKNEKITKGDNSIALNIESLSSGSYIIKFICVNGCEKTIQKFVKE